MGKPRRDLLPDPVLLGLGLLALACVPWFLAGPGGPGTSWLLQTGLDLSLVVFAVRLARLSAGQRYSRRFWRAMAVATALCAIGDGFQTFLVLSTGTATISVFQTALVVLAMSTMVVVMLCHPLGTSGRQRLRLGLDAATVLIAVAVFLWYFSLGSQLSSGHGADRYVAAASSAVMLVIAFGVLKLILSGTAPFTLAAGIAGSVGVAGSALGTSIALIVTGGSNPRAMIVVALLPCILTAASLRLQEVQLRRRAGDSLLDRTRRFSRMPYLAVIATQVLLVVALLGTRSDARIWGLSIGVVLITALVLGRQLIAFHDNDRLVTTLDSQREWFLALAQHASDVTMVVDEAGRIRYASPAVARVLGTAPEAAVGEALHDHVHPQDLPVFAGLRDRLTSAPGTDASAQVRLRHADGSYRWLDIVGVDLLGNPDVAGVVYNARDVTQAHRLQEELRHQATHDGLTGLANRALLGERLREAATAAELSVLVIDLDGFKEINDVHGHHVGDDLLIAVAQRLRAALSPGDTAARLGGDEFAMLLPGAGTDRAAAVAAAVELALSEPIALAGHLLGIGASVGTATGTAADLDYLLRDADARMYRVKNDRRQSLVGRHDLAVALDEAERG
jgi:diguanylate cyclase (GGDEF)-like protein/PAS domain S-box-containing protein